MAEDSIKLSGVAEEYRDNRGGAALIEHAVIGIVKDNIDPTHSGRIRVYISEFGGSSPDDDGNWISVKYLSPFAGNISPNYDPYNSAPRDNFGNFISNAHSYGFWASAPDIGSKVICIFINGKPNDGYYFGCVPESGLTHMIPAIAGGTTVVPNEGEADLYGGANRLPVTEVNYSNPDIRNSSTVYSQPKPVHSYQANILARQGLIRDDVRGVISSSSQRETPSRVFGWSTPGQAIYEGGYTNSTIKQAAQKSDSSALQIVGRTGGHSFVMDDGTIDGQDQLVRLRTTAGHMIMMHDSGQMITIIHSNGQSYIELGREGTIDLYSTNSVNIRTEGDLNLHAERDINLNAKRNINTYAQAANTEVIKDYSVRVGGSYYNYVNGKYTLKVGQQMSLHSSGNASFLSSAINYLNGKKLHLNTGSSSVVPGIVPEMPKTNHIDTTFSEQKGWMNPAPEPITSITTRAPAHMPWAAGNKGVAL